MTMIAEKEIDIKEIEIMEAAFSLLKKLTNANQDGIFFTFVSYMVDGYMGQTNKSLEEKLKFMDMIKDALEHHHC